MASLERRGNRFRVIFRYLGQKYQHPLKSTELKDAELACSRVEENLRLLERGRLELPADADLPTFLLSDGKLSGPPKPTKSLTLDELSRRYKEAIAIGALEENSRYTVAIHLRHIAETLGEGFKLQELTGESLQEHINRGRKKGKGVRGKLLSAYTIRKEIVTFGAAFKWGVEMGLLSGTFPNRELKYPKLDEKEPFLTWDEITRRIRSGQLSRPECESLWNSLFLSTSEVAELLEHVKDTAFQPWVFPMVAFAAHTGARRSEILRTRLFDVDFESGTVLLHEQKRDKEKRTMRRVPLSPYLASVLRDWTSSHPGGTHLFVQSAEVVRSKAVRRGPTAVTPDEAHDHLHRTLAESKFQVIRGWHTLRHSFASNCAASGVDQRLIDSWMGHQTEEMRRRYRHHFPNQERAAICQVFGASTEE